MSALDLPLGRARPAKAKKKRKAKSRAASVSTEYSLLLTATLCLLAFGAVMVFSASSTTQVLQNGGLADSAYYLQRTLIVGAIGCGGLLFTQLVFNPPIWLEVLIWLPLIAIMTLGALRPFKATFVALQFHNRASEARRDDAPRG